MSSPVEFLANGKLLLSGEYFVLEGALSIGLPTQPGQKMVVKENPGSDIIWESYSPNGSTWFSGKFDLFGFDPIKYSDLDTANRLKSILIEAVRLNSEFLSRWKKYRVSTFLEFDKDWGLGSSSTLITCIAQWAEVDPFELQFNTFGGSGYDIACATAQGPIFYQLGDYNIESYDCPFDPQFKDQLYLVYIGKKQNTQDGIQHFENRRNQIQPSTIDDISALSKEISESKNLSNFEHLISEHERLVAKSLDLEMPKTSMFRDYWGEIKSLGAWGGDFILATSDRGLHDTKAYFTSKGLDTVFAYDSLVRSKCQKEASIA